MNRSRAQLVAFAQQSMARGSKSFAAASKLFDQRTRERVWLLYAWCRACDDMADGQDHGGAMGAVADEDKMAVMAHMRALTQRAIEGEKTGEPAFDCLGIVAAETGLTLPMAEAVLEGFALDLADWRPQSEDDLYRYCYHVAGAVGVLMAVVMGVSPDDEDTLNRACDLGLAFQLANIARDLMEDNAAGRCYLPLEWLVQAGIAPGQHMKPVHRAATVRMVQRMTKRAALHEASARVGAARLPFRARWAVLSAAGIYGAIGRKVAAAGQGAWDQRVHTSKVEKAGFLGKALIAAVRNNPLPASREGLYSAFL